MNWRSLNQYPDFDRSYEGFALQYLGEAYTNKQDFKQAIQSYQKALVIFTDLKDSGQGDLDSLQQSIIYTLNPLGAVYFQLGDYQQSRAIYLQVLALQSENSIAQVQTLNNLGVVASNLNQYAQAFRYYQKALDLLDQFSGCHSETTDKVCYGGDEASILNNLAILYFTLGQYEQAINFSEQATLLYQRLTSGDFYDLAARDFQFLYDVIGTASINALFTHQSLAIRPAVGDNYNKSESIVRQGEAVNYNNLGQIYNSQEQPEKALAFYQKALDIYQNLGNQQGLGITYNNLANVYLILKQFDQALAFNEKALQVYKEVGDQTGIGITFSNAGQIYSEQGDFKQGKQKLNQALAIHQQNNDQSNVALTLRNLGFIDLKERNSSDAIKNLQQSIAIVESLRPGLNDASKIALFETQSLAYSWLQKALIENQQSEEALIISENSKARAFLELLAQRLNDSELSDLHQGTIMPVENPSIEKIKLIAQQNQGTLVQYSIIPNDKLYIWVINSHGEINFRQVDLAQLKDENNEPITLTQLVIDSRNSLFARHGDPSQAEFRNLYQILIQPIEDLLPANPDESIFLIPQGSLFMIPFAALLDQSNQYLLEKHTIVIEPSIQALEFTNQQKRINQQVNLQNTTIVGLPRQTVIVGNPTMPTIEANIGESPITLSPLPGAEVEAKEVATILNDQALTGDQATKKTVIQQMLKSRIIHLATHGLLDDLGRKGIPGAIALAPADSDDGLLSASEIINLKLNADLVVLSACNTGRGKITGDGVIGLSRSFLGAGASSVVVSLWSVQDQSTAFLMPEFYRQLQQNQNKAQALRQAMLKTMEFYPKPQDWAAFTLIGEANSSGFQN